MEIIVSRWNWERFQEGAITRLEKFTEEQLHHIFGEQAEKESVRLKIEKTRSDE